MEPTKEPNIVKWIDIILDFLLGKNRESKEYYNTYCSCSGKELYLVILDNIFRLAISGIGVGVLA